MLCGADRTARQQRIPYAKCLHLNLTWLCKHKSLTQTQVFDACPAQTKSQVRHLSDDICLLKLRSSMSPNLPSIKKSTRSMKSLAIQELWWLASLPMCLGETNSWFLRNVFFWWHSCQKLAHFHMHYPFVQKLIATNQCQLHKKTPLATINLYSLTKKMFRKFVDSRHRTQTTRASGWHWKKPVVPGLIWPGTHSRLLMHHWCQKHWENSNFAHFCPNSGYEPA